MTTSLIVPVMKNFKGFAQLMESVDEPVFPVVIPNWDENIGVGPAWNQGLQRAVQMGHEYAIVSNDDVILSPGLIDELKAMVDGGADVASPTNVTGVCHPRGLNFWFWMCKPQSFIDQFGLFDENYAPAYFEDDDMAYRIHLAGGTIRTTASTAYHQVMGTQAMDDKPVVGPDVWGRNYFYYCKKWGGAPGQETYTTPFGDNNKTWKDW